MLTEQELQILNGPPAIDTSQLPDELKGFNWGAFWLTCVWGGAHKAKVTNWIILAVILSSIPVTAIMVIGFILTFALAIFFGVKGNEWAWKNGKFTSNENFKRTERIWAWTGWIIVILLTAAIIYSVYYLDNFIKSNNIDLNQFNAQNINQIKDLLQ